MASPLDPMDQGAPQKKRDRDQVEDGLAPTRTVRRTIVHLERPPCVHPFPTSQGTGVRGAERHQVRRLRRSERFRWQGLGRTHAIS